MFTPSLTAETSPRITSTEAAPSVGAHLSSVREPDGTISTPSTKDFVVLMANTPLSAYVQGEVRKIRIIARAAWMSGTAHS